ncbi:MAG: Hsp20/alpha crystallin family protein [Gemmataceae bacterium]|nr:Hsp20/alpha crystallin family protein [Gemmataceae bacterium]
MSSVATKANGTGGDLAAERAVTVTPRVDILETEHEFLLLADLPGVTADGVDIRFEQGELTIHGKRPAKYAGKDEAVREHPGTNFSRVFGVAETVAADKIEADLKHGVLTVRLPKVEAVKPRKIAVRG